MTPASVITNLSAARLWLLAVVVLGEALLDHLKDGLWDEQAPMQPYVGEIAEWTRRIDRWRALDNAELVVEYRRWRDRNPVFANALVRAGAKWQRALNDNLKAQLRGGR